MTGPLFVVGLLVAAYAVPAILLVVLDRVRGVRVVPATEQLISRANPYPTQLSLLGVGVLAVLYFYQKANVGEAGRIALVLVLVALLINGRFAYVVLGSAIRFRNQDTRHGIRAWRAALGARLLFAIDSGDGVQPR